MKGWDNTLLGEALGDAIDSHIEADGLVQFNSKNVTKGDVFIALKGENGDGHDYILDAHKNGASIIITQVIDRRVPEEKQIIVQDTHDALNSLAKYKRSKSKAKIIAITGSAGKTSTKEGLYHILSKFGKSFASRGSFNNALGVPLELASMPLDTEYAVFEVGMNHPGEIRSFIGLIKPHMVLINNIFPAHIEFFDSIKGIADAKLEILEGLDKDGIAIFNRDSEFFDYSCERAAKLGISDIYSFGDIENGNKDSDAKLIEYSYENGKGAHVVEVGSQKISFETRIGGRHRILNFVPSLLIATILGLDLKKAASLLIELEEPKGRGKSFDIRYSGHNCRIIDDAYNANPTSMVNSIEHLGNLNHPYKVCILGNMGELGKNEIQYHMDLLPHILKSGISKVHLVGHLMKELYNILPEELKGNFYDDYKALEQGLGNIIDRDMMILLKASKGVKLWHIVDVLESAKEKRDAV